MRISVEVVLVLGALSSGCASGPQVDAEAEEAAVRARSEGVARAEAAMDADAAAEFWAEDAIIQPPGAPQTQGRAAIRNLYRELIDSSGLKEFTGTSSHIQVAASGDLAYEYGVNRMVFATPNGDLVDTGKYLAVWLKIDSEWFVAALSFTSDAPAPPAAATQTPASGA